MPNKIRQNETYSGLRPTKVDLTEFYLNVRIIIFAVILIIIILLTIYFVRSYASKKQNIIHNMRAEANILETILIEDINYSTYFMDIIARQVINDPYNIKHIRSIFKAHMPSSNFSTLFGWRKYSWIDENFQEIVTSTKGVEANPKDLSFLKNLVNTDPDWQDKIIFYTNKTPLKNDSLKLMKNISDQDTGSYAGSLILSYDIATMIRRMKVKKRQEQTNFVLMDTQLKVIAQSSPVINEIIDGQENFSPELYETLQKFTINNSPFKDLSYIDIIGGVNYHIKKVNDLPFILIINTDNKEIKQTILESIARKITEVAIFVSIFLVMVISIYRREIFLRSKAQQATKLANRATKAKSEFLAFTAHEIRSPLGFIVTGSEIMIKQLIGNLPLSYMQYAEGIHKNAKLILDFITDILDENQIIEGKFKIVNSMVDLNSIIEEAIVINKARFNDRKIEINFQGTEALPKLICDQRRILQVVNNLLSNAIKYSNDDTVISISTELLDDKLEFMIKDQGIGMSENEIKIALSMHGVAQKRSHDFIESYGLGLPIVKMLLDAHEAALTIKSEPNVGTQIKIIFPKFKLIFNRQ